MSILEQAAHVYSKEKQTRSTLKIGSPCLFWRQAVHVIWILTVHVYILKNGHWTVLIYTGGRQPCPFWRLVDSGSP